MMGIIEMSETRYCDMCKRHHGILLPHFTIIAYQNRNSVFSENTLCNPKVGDQHLSNNDSFRIETSLDVFSINCIMNKHDLCTDLKYECLCHDKKMN